MQRQVDRNDTPKTDWECLGNHLADSRTYHTCAKKKRKPHNKLKLSKEKK